jgi:large subunit ribosomal protein L25
VIDLGDGKSFTAILKDIQVHPVTDDILHIDFFQIFGDKEITIEVPVKIIGDSKGVMAGGDLRLNNRKLKVKPYLKIFLILLKLILHHYMGNKLYVTQVPTPDFKIMHPDNSNLSSEDFSCSYESSSRSSKSSKSTCKRKNNIFQSYLKHQL